ncbi:hypothetical protein LPB67_18040 [Undibacterium sp. Jales W-56]|uniref:bestrophin-like domain n=1 Tax=Undibacterium sp. Jales W-56 TaxID=2897325 RepID=UPI0021D1D597|nr:hypothetical protein [Undibacterium sp. Jales W-56]MCU6435682.1 hypothetical protein [Undibacterium sp. Jales W-56]
MEILYRIDAWKIALTLLIFLFFVIELSYRLGTRSDPLAYEKSSSVFSTLMGAALALLGLLLAFSFAMASARYDLRKGVILKEANAIGTTYLRSDLLEPAVREQVKSKLKRYAEVRLAAHQAGIDSQKQQEVSQSTGKLQDEIWAIASSELRRERQINNSLFVQALNDMIDVSTEQNDAHENHVPESVFWLLFISALLTAALSGYACGAIGNRNLMATSVFALLVALVIFSIIDLDRPQRGLIQVTQHPMQLLLNGMH